MQRLARFQPVKFDERIVVAIEAAAIARALPCRRMTSDLPWCSGPDSGGARVDALAVVGNHGSRPTSE